VIELRHLRHLLALAEHGNFSRAADALHITQPALSRSIQALEASVGATLFDRNRSGIEPTEIGRLLLRHARSFDASAQDLDREVRLSKGLELGELRIGVGPYGGAALVGPVVGQLNRLHPRLRVRLTIAPWTELPERARARDVDVVVAELSELGTLDDFESQPLSEHRANFVCRTDHPVTRLPAVRLQDLYVYPIAGPRLPPAAEKALIDAAPNEQREYLRRAGLLTIECDSAKVLKVILTHSDALSMMPRFMVEAEARAGELVVLPDLDVDLRQRTRFGAAWLRHRSMSGAGRKFVELLCAHDAVLAADLAVHSAAAKRMRHRSAARNTAAR
jgi:DNA-binding transcriptional LysR family regulator